MAIATPPVFKTVSPPGSRAVEQGLINLFGWVPRPVGILLRRQTYSLIFGQMGKGVYIQADVEVLGGKGIELGNEVSILRSAILNFNYPGSSLRLGDRVNLDRGVDIRAAGEKCRIEIGEDTYIGPYGCIAGPGDIRIGKQCLIASQVGIYANNHRPYGLSREGIVIEDRCWLGSGVKVTDGVTIGEGSVIGAGAVVTKNIPPNSVAVGVPAKVIKSAEGGVV